MNSIEFCSETSEITDSLIDLCTTDLTSLNRGEVLKMYQIWNQQFFNYPASEDFDKCRSVISNKFACPSAASYLGIDFPTWLNFKDSKEERKRIMIVGIDPLRSEENPGLVSIGTPYAFHHKIMREGHTGEYWKFIENLAREYSLYITDIFKVFFYGGPGKTNRSYSNKDFVINPLHQEILAKEIEIVNPDIIITMGNLATRLVLDDKNQRFFPISRFNVSERTLKHKSNTDLIPMVHLSGSSRGGQKIFLETNNKMPKPGSTNGDLYYEIIEAYLGIKQDSEIDSPVLT